MAVRAVHLDIGADGRCGDLLPQSLLTQALGQQPDRPLPTRKLVPWVSGLETDLSVSCDGGSERMELTVPFGSSGERTADEGYVKPGDCGPA